MTTVGTSMSTPLVASSASTSSAPGVDADQRRVAVDDERGRRRVGGGAVAAHHGGTNRAGGDRDESEDRLRFRRPAGAADPRHRRARVGNAYRLPNGTVGFCDWQTLAQGRWAHDVAYFVASAFEPDERARAEHDLLLHYLDRLIGHGVDAPSFDDTWTDYRRHMVYGLFGWLTNLEQFQPEESITATIERFAAAAVELDTYDTLDVS
jgi:hypothetical protein